MKECDILGGQNILWPLLHIFRGSGPPNSPWSTPLITNDGSWDLKKSQHRSLDAVKHRAFPVDGTGDWRLVFRDGRTKHQLSKHRLHQIHLQRTKRSWCCRGIKRIQVYIPRQRHSHNPSWCASGCVVQCRICNREVAGSNFSLGYYAQVYSAFHPSGVGKMSTSFGSYEYQLRQVWLIPIADERVGVQVKLWDPLRTSAIPERFWGDDSLRRGAISSVCTFTFTFIM